MNDSSEFMREFNDYISARVNYYKTSQGLNYEKIASYLDVSENFIKQVNSSQINKHYNLYHLWKLAQLFKVSVDQLLPPIDDYSAFLQIHPMSSKNDYQNFLKKYKSKEASIYETKY